MAYSAISYLEQCLKQLRNTEYVFFTADAIKEFLSLEEHLVNIEKDGKLLANNEKYILEVVYEGQDLIDSFVARELEAERSAIQIPRNRNDLARELRKLRIYDCKPDSSLGAGRSSTSSINPMKRSNSRQGDLDFEQTVVGFDYEIKESLIDRLLKDSDKVEVIPIVGKPGAGKTTLAKMIYDDRRIVSHFPNRIWITVSEYYAKRDFYIDILKAFGSVDLSDKISVDDLASKAAKYLLQVEFLLVIDEGQEASNFIQNLQVSKGGSCKVLMTTDKLEVALIANPNKEAHTNLNELLKKEQSLSLLKFPAKDKTLTLDKLPVIARGDLVFLPLAIVLVMGILNYEYAKDIERERVSERLQDGDDPDGEWPLKNLISMSYDYLPHDLRGCFLYLGVFPINTEIPVWKLMRLWIAEGLISGSDNSNLEDIAKDYLHELINRNLVMIGARNFRGEVKICRVHHIIHRFCRSEATKLNFLQVIDSDDFDVTGNMHRISIHPRHWELGTRRKNPVNEHSRSLICFSNSNHGFDPLAIWIKVETRMFPLLRVFEGSPFQYPKFRLMFTQFLLLKYLSLTVGESFNILPHFSVKLQNLETLIINTPPNHSFILMPTLSDMKQLRYLKTKAAIVLNVESSEASSNLQTLHRLSTKSCKDSVLRQTPNLLTLSISGDISSLKDTMYFENLVSLQRLKVIDKTSYRKMEKPAFWRKEQFPPSLRTLTLSGTNLNWDYMRTLGRLPHLEALKLKDYAFRGDIWNVNDGEFNHLQFLKIEGSDLSLWNFKGGCCFAKLRYLSLKNCGRLRKESLPLTWEKESLEILEIENVRTNRKTAERLDINFVRKRTMDEDSKIESQEVVLHPGFPSPH